VSGKQRTCLGKHDAALSACALDEALADQRFECCDLMADCRLGVAETLGGAAKGAGFGDGLKGDEMAQLEAGPIMQLHTIFDDTSALDTYLHVRDAEGMELLAFVAALIVFDLVVARFASDSRILDPRDTRGWWPGTRSL
jgi:hypothetical protein